MDERCAPPSRGGFFTRPSEKTREYHDDPGTRRFESETVPAVSEPTTATEGARERAIARDRSGRFRDRTFFRVTRQLAPALVAPSSSSLLRSTRSYVPSLFGFFPPPAWLCFPAFATYRITASSTHAFSYSSFPLSASLVAPPSSALAPNTESLACA